MRQKQLVQVILTLAVIIAVLIYRLNRIEKSAADRKARETEQSSTEERGGTANRDNRKDSKSTTSRRNQNGNSGEENANDKGIDANGRHESLAFNRKLSKIVYSRHARCRMDCRNIDESEILEMRDKGKVNYAKSELNASRDPRFALEGITHDKQRVRVVFAQTDTSLVVVTCIDLDTEWACSCN